MKITIHEVVNGFYNSLAARCERYMEEAKGRFKLWGRVTQAEQKAKLAQLEANNWQFMYNMQSSVVGRLEKDLLIARNATSKETTQAHADKLLAIAAEIFGRPGDQQQYVILSWLAEYREYRTREHPHLGGRA